MRTLERLRGEFDDNLPTLRLPRIGTRVLLRDVAAARKLALAELSRKSDGIPVAIVPDTTHELSARDLEIETEEPEVFVQDVVIDESAQVDTRDLWPLPSGPISIAPRVVTNDVTTPRILVLRERTAEYPRAAMPMTSVEISLAPLLQASLGPGYHETRVLELEQEPRVRRPWRGVILGFAAGTVLALVAAATVQPNERATPVAPTLAGLDRAIEFVQPKPTPPRLVPIGGPPVVVPLVLPSAPPPSLATPPSPPLVVAIASTPRAAPARVRSRSRRVEEESYEPEVVTTPVAIGVAVMPANDGAALLRDAERAFASGRHATALLYADRSRAATNDPRATRIAALAACQLRRVAKAEAAWLALPQGQRTSVRNACLKHGVELGAPKLAAATTPRT